MLLLDRWKLFIASAILAFSTNCGQSSSGGTSSPAKDSIPLKAAERVEMNQSVEESGFAIITFPDQPIALLSLRVTEPSKPEKTQLVLEVQNTSAKTVELLVYGISVSPQCSEFMHTMMPTPKIGYGDWRVEGEGFEQRSIDPPLTPNATARITVSGDEELPKFLYERTYATCPDGQKKPQLMLQAVYFSDGAVWRPNQKPLP